MKQLIVGLGNPGAQYNFTRHNFGFLALDFYAKIKGFTWQPHQKHAAIWAQQGDYLFIKPQTFYNDSGLAVRDFAKFYKIPPEHILVICDDFNLNFGHLRYRETGTAGGNNGLKSTILHLGTDKFPRLRLGTGNPEMRQKLGDTDFVLAKFTPEEKEQLPRILKQTSNKIDNILS